ncbi:DUF2092 domain-containing protein [Cryobacterium sp. TMT2-18-3]|uniref:LolA family protein n=1 Tax=unclassified Cryobacterium TaxID=2649013 RepID=UPI00106B7AAB|nr:MULTISPECIES: DUF2092 domain-containing protein [unclassified Cryobacterium]TFC29011.1 DUF2092 domain-containing protein [Cryobacterium sp. TMT2-18-2]TFC38496.1 DUF2092 domain-containing protein [Cryobacterium sp. TMT2-42-4]TFC66304.1 DUF2092 domain-containing protein [Cryobacterium sp. TMT2-18-3]
MSRNSTRWLPAIVVPVVIVAGVIAVPLQAGATVDLPDKTPEQVLLMVSDSTISAFSGTVDKTAELGLPDIDLNAGMSDSMSDSMAESAPEGTTEAGAAATGALASVMELFSGSHTARIYVDGSDSDGPAKARVQIQDRMAERNVVSNGTDVWTYDSETNTASHLTIPADARAIAEAQYAAIVDSAPAGLSTPSQVAERFLSEIDPSTTVSVGTDGTVAGRTAYELVLTPKATRTLVESVSISVDSETGVPLQVTVRADGQEDPAFQVGFTAVDFSTPSADLFDFTPPAGATVEEIALPVMPEITEMTADQAKPEIPAENLPLVTGSGWDAIVEVPAASVPSELNANPLILELATAVDGGRLFSTALVNVFLTDDGRVFAGSVPVEMLQAAAAQ